MSFRDRLKRLEEDAGGGGFLIVRFEGGVPGYEEPLDQQLAKLAHARATGARFVCLGGCGPDRE